MGVDYKTDAKSKRSLAMQFILETVDYEEVAIYNDARVAWKAYLQVDPAYHRIRVIA